MPPPDVPKPGVPFIAAKHPFNRAVKPAWMQAGPPIWQDSRAVILTGPEPQTPQEIEQELPMEAPQPRMPEDTSPDPLRQESRGPLEPPLVHRPVKPRIAPPPVPVRKPLPPKIPVESLPPPKLATQSEHGSSTDSNLTASDASQADSDSDSEDSLSSTSTTSSAAELMAKRRVSTYRLLPPRGIPLEVLRSSEPPPPHRHGEHRERARPHGPRTREPPPLPPRPSVHPIVEETAEDIISGHIDPVPARQQVNSVPAVPPMHVAPPSFPPKPKHTETTPQAKNAPEPVLKVENEPVQEIAPEPEARSSHAHAREDVVVDPEFKPVSRPPPVPARKPHARKPSNGKIVTPIKTEQLKETTFQERILATLLPEAPSHERSLSKDLQESIRASIVPPATVEHPTGRARPAPYKPIGGSTTPQTAPVFQTAQPKRKKAANGQPTGKLNIRPRLDDRPELELKSQLALRVNRWRMKEIPWTREEIEDELRRMEHQVDDDDPPPKVERTHSSPEVATRGLEGAKGSGRIRDPQLRLTSNSTAEALNKPSNRSDTQTSPTSPKRKLAGLEQNASQAASRDAPAPTAHRRTASAQEPVPVQQNTFTPQLPVVTRAPTVEYTDLDLAAARLEGTSDEFEVSLGIIRERSSVTYRPLQGIREITSFVSENAKHGATPSELSNLFIAPVEVESRRVTKEGKTKLKLSALGVRVLKCTVCLNNFRSGDIMAMMPKCGHVGHQKCVVEWLKRDARCMVCREAL